MDTDYMDAVRRMAHAIFHYQCCHADTVEHSPHACASEPHVMLATSAEYTAACLRFLFREHVRHRRHRLVLEPASDVPWPQLPAPTGADGALASPAPELSPEWFEPCAPPSKDVPSSWESGPAPTAEPWPPVPRQRRRPSP